MEAKEVISDEAKVVRGTHEPEIIGKPNPYVIELIKAEQGITDSSR